LNELEKIIADPRVTVRRSATVNSAGKCVVYWMQRSMRAINNHALDFAIAAANALQKPTVVFLAPVPFYPRANLRHYTFLMQGLPDIATGLRRRNVGFVLRRYPQHQLLAFCNEVDACLLVGDENPMRDPEHWRALVQSRTQLPFWTVDSDVIVPSNLLEKQQFAAYTIRPRIRALLPQFLNPAKNLPTKVPWQPPAGLQSIDPQCDITAGWEIDRSVGPVSEFIGGTQEGMRRLRLFVSKKLDRYAQTRNHPELDGTSRLSPYLHFGHLGPHTVAIAVQNADALKKSKDAFLEELIVRRELAINFVRFNADYDKIESAPAWARRTLTEHSADRRPVRYSEAQLDKAETHDPLWNAAQMQMVLTGWMHNYMRMYWAKKILEWSDSPAQAYGRAVRLNDKYELDGRDPNSYEGIAWAIAGKSDRAWFDRPIFGKVRYMSFASTSRKFDSKCYVEQIAALKQSQTEIFNRSN
jgi:deoxyribodipyrimidine photo-lyase